MIAPRKLSFTLLLAVLAISLVATYAITTNAQSTNPAIQASVSASNQGVSNVASYICTINNTGSENVVNLNITVPIGYSNVEITQQPDGWTVTNDLTQQGSNFILLSTSGQGLSPGQGLTFSFNAKNPPVAGTYPWVVNSVNTAETNIGFVSPQYKIDSLFPAIAILGIAAGIAFLNTGINRSLINYFVGWEQYHVMQKEMSEYRSESMAAARSGDKKQMEKLKKKDSQIKNMQAKMLKPQMVQFGISFVYLLVWFVVLTPTFGNMSMAYLPGFGPISVFYLYPIFSFFLGLLSQRIIGVMPIEPRF